MSAAVANVADTRAILNMLGPRPDHEAVDEARRALVRIDDRVTEELDELIMASAPAGENIAHWRAAQAEKEKELKEVAEKEKVPYKSVIQLDDLHLSYEEMVKQAELALDENFDPSAVVTQSDDEVDLEVAKRIQDAYEKKLDHLDLSGRNLMHLPESFGKISSLVSVTLSNNRLEIIPDSIAGLVNLERLDVQSNQLKALPDSLGLLSNLKFLDLSGNMVVALPDTIGRCRNLVVLIANFNQLEYWPSFEVFNLQKLCLHLNKLTGLPSSIGEMRSLRVLDVHFNRLRSLPVTIGNLSNLEVLDVSSNFNNLVTVPDSIGDLASLTDLDLSFNQIRELPISFGRLTNLKRLKLDENPLVVPPMEVVQHSHEAVMAYLADRWKSSLMTDEEKSLAGSGRKLDSENGGEWVSWAGGVWASNWLGRMCTRGLTQFLGGNTAKVMGWQEHRSDDEPGCQL